MTQELWTIGDEFADFATSACGHRFADCDSRETAKRTADLWNALATIPDPQAFMEAARGMREALEAICLMQARNYGDGIRTHLEFIGLADEGRAAIATFDATLGEQ